MSARDYSIDQFLTRVRKYGFCPVDMGPLGVMFKHADAPGVRFGGVYRRVRGGVRLNRRATLAKLIQDRDLYRMREKERACQFLPRDELRLGGAP